MEILSLIKDKLTDLVIDKVSGFLGEHPEKISPALQSAVPTVLGSIMESASTDEGTAKIMDVLKDGGHTGEILDDLPSLLGNFDKTQLLITIGTNIFNHFSGEKNNGIVEKLASLNGIRKTSSASLLGLAAPLVMGAIGKIVAKEGLGVSGLSKLLTEQKEGVLAALPPALSSQLGTKKSTTNTNSTVEIIEKSNENKPSNGSNWLIPLLLLGILALGVFGYWWKYKRQTQIQSIETENIISTNADSTKADDFMSAPIDTTKLVETTSTEPIASEKKVEPIKTEKIVETKPVETNNSNAGTLSEQLKTNNSWISLSNTDFGKNGAEIKKKGNLDDLAKYLKNNKKAKIQIAGGSESSGNRLSEDRAYAIFGYLIEKGVNETQMDVKDKQEKNADGKVVVKVVKR